MRRVLFYGADADACARVRSAVSPHAHVRAARDVQVLERDFVAGHVALVVLDIDAACASAITPWVAGKRTAHPDLNIVAYGPLQAASAHCLFGLARAGANGLIVRGHDDERSRFAALLRNPPRAGVAEAVCRSVGPAELSPDGLALLRWLLSRSHHPLSVDDVAGAHGVHRKTLRARFSACGLPAPSEAVGWSRLLVTAYLLDGSAASVAAVADVLHYPSVNAMRNLFARYVERPPAAIRGSALQTVSERFVGACGAARRDRRRARPVATRLGGLAGALLAPAVVTEMEALVEMFATAARVIGG